MRKSLRAGDTRKKKRSKSSSASKQAKKDLPFPETDYPPTLQRTLKRKFEEAKAKGEIEAVDRDEFFRTLGRTAQRRDESSDEGQ